MATAEPAYDPAIGGAPTDATYLTQTASSTLSAEQAMGSLTTGLVKNAATTGVQSIAVVGTDYSAALAREYYMSLAMSRCGVASGDKAFGFGFEDFDSTASTVITPRRFNGAAGSGAMSTRVANSKGGIVQITTGATAGSLLDMHAYEALIDNLTTQKWWIGHRQAVTTAVTAATTAASGAENVAGTKTIVAGVMGNGGGAATNFSLQYDGSFATSFLDLGVAIDTAFHLFEIYSKGESNNKIYVRVDEGSELSVTAASSPTDSVYLVSRMANGGDAVARTMQIDFSACLFPR